MNVPLILTSVLNLSKTMKTFLAILLSSCLIAAVSAELRLNSLKYALCKGSPRNFLKIEKFNIRPFPLSLVEGQTVTVEGWMKLLQKIGPGAKVKVKLARDSKLFNFDLPIPCKIGELNFCELDVQQILGDFSHEFCPTRPNFFPHGQECTLPMKTGQYGGKMTLRVPKIPGVIEFFGPGHYSAEASLIVGGRERVCLAARLSVTNVQLACLTGRLSLINVQLAYLTGRLSLINVQLACLTGRLSLINVQLVCLTGRLSPINVQLACLTGRLSPINVQLACLTSKVVITNV